MSELIILEGLDDQGKTTAAFRLVDGRSRVAYLHAGPPRSENALDEYLFPLLDLARDGWDVVCDRWHLGELVWPSVFGRGPGMLTSQAVLDALEEGIAELFDVVQPVIVDMGAVPVGMSYSPDDVRDRFRRAQARSSWRWIVRDPSLIDWATS